MLHDHPQPKVKDMVNEKRSENAWVQQDGATSHTSSRPIEILRDIMRYWARCICTYKIILSGLHAHPT